MSIPRRKYKFNKNVQVAREASIKMWMNENFHGMQGLKSDAGLYLFSVVQDISGMNL